MPQTCPVVVISNAYSYLHEANGLFAVGAIRIGVMTMLTSTMQKIQNVGANNVGLGIGLALGATYLPFVASFQLSRVLGLTAAAYSGSGNLVAGFGLAATILAGIAIYDMRKSTKALLIITAIIFGMFGALASLTV